jgi:hypothetical protein
MDKWILAFVGLLMIGLPVMAPAAPESEKTAAETAPSRQAGATTNLPGYDKDEVVCRRERVTGSRMTRNLCHTREQWEAMRKAGVQGTKNVQDAPVPIMN